MSTYIVGDIQGCLDELLLLLKQVSFDKKHDQLLVAGDLVARGPKSLETLRFIKDLGKAAKVVLGNHDLHLLAVSIGRFDVKAKDNTTAIFSAKDKDKLLSWLRKQPLFIEHDEFVLCHAGISPQWDLITARSAAHEIETLLQGAQWQWLIENMYGDTPETWSNDLSGLERYRYIINAFTRMRFVDTQGRLDMLQKKPPSEIQNAHLVPWFQYPDRIEISKSIIFGHWAALQGYRSKRFIGLDTGCVWGGELTMIRWEDRVYFTQKSITNPI
ncbi:symmetrical bis(5'-nucleosyl)-tetraphosphatase [Vibrio sp. S4M6]|uniref:symmetrical bis(5'-nucleosyl)-tetraphosphatase n=1 Tax=Vibrio sinus TaxID=2946865 RepID=UPI00202A909D|nr:symmetrical bis(5'-nucleosyl)-tetraphosphatase [Vibrio sinus]MCL9780556.1 symmetrical bis(5'-nucleosyl)-tetraphosphatase [Vibrio sinus]